MDVSNVCRTCLSSSNLNPIFLNPDDNMRYSSILYLTTGLKVEVNDGLPQKMCTNCINNLNNSLKFRKQCRNAEVRLLEIKSSLECMPNKDLVIVNNEETHSSENSFQKQIKIEINYEENNEHSQCDEEKLLKYLNEDVCNNSETDFIEEAIKPVSNIIKLSNIHTELPYQEVTSTESKNQRVMCKLCQKNLSIRSIDTHMARSHPGADKRKVKCDLCDNYVLKEKLNRHRVMMHGNETFRCCYCKSEYDTRELLVEHVATCTSKKKKRKISNSSREMSECDVCNKRMQKASLRMHKAVKHAGLGPVCEHCGNRFGNKFRLNEHYRAKHGYEKFKCSYCDFQSAGVMAMRNHERRHRGEKPFSCELCAASFHAAYLLAQHRQSHRVERLLKCDQCPASFKANNSLHVHKRSCHGPRRLRCSHCARAYSSRHYVVRHLRRVHKLTGPVPDLIMVPKED